MKIEFKKSFLKDLQHIQNRKLKNSILDVIQQVEQADQPNEIKNLKRLKGFNRYYRIRIGNYRIGLEVSNNTVVFVVFSNRRDIYRIFP